jgi:hypothetical protein
MKKYSYKICTYAYNLPPYKFHMLSYSDSSVTSIKPKNKQISSNCHIISQFLKIITKKLSNVAYFG